ncbi:MAG: Spo0B domain-containing protein [Oscillospiraceae bacterium]|nr:Spo0B domain-containing protein [Oscillospiraceae bacterium]
METQHSPSQRKSPQTIQKYFFRTQLFLLISLSLVLAVAGVLLDVHAERLERDQNLRNVAEAIAHSPVLHDEARRTETLDAMKSSFSNIDVISVVSAGGARIYHSNHALIGTVYDGTLPDFSQTGRDFYAVNDRGPSGLQRRAYAAFYENGNYAGFVITLTLMEQIRGENLRLIAMFAAITLLAVLTALFLSYRFSDKIKASLMGYEPDAFSAMYQIRDHILEALDEGVIAVDRSGKVQFSNQAAEKLLVSGNGEAAESGSRLLTETLKSGKKERGVPVHDFSGADILADRIPIKAEGRIAGAVAILHDRTEYTKLMEDLAGTRYLVDSMRANNHDFTNKLHVILGLIQMGMSDKAASYIENITMVQRESISRIMQTVDEPAVSALLVGKTARASELNIRLVLREGSIFRRSDLPLPADALVTILGNLIDNALEAMNASPCEGEQMELVLGLFSKPGALLLTADDNGPGIAEDLLPHIFEEGFSTKGAGHGTGLPHVKKLVEALGGSISVQSQPGEGSSFAVSFQKEAV